MSQERTGSLPRQAAPRVEPAKLTSCPACGSPILVRSVGAGCPNCRRQTNVPTDGDDFTKKVVDDNDLIKSF